MTARLAKAAVENWADFDGYAVAHGMPDLRELPLDRFCSFVWHMLSRNADEQGVAKLRAKLWQPPKGEVITDTASPWHPDNEKAAFNSLKAGLGLSTPNLSGEVPAAG